MKYYYASSQAPAWEFGVGSSSFPSREATICMDARGRATQEQLPRASLPEFTIWSSHRYTQVFKSTSSRQGLPGSRSHGWQYRNWQQVLHRELPNKINRSHPCALDSGNPCRNDGLPQTRVYNDDSWNLEASVFLNLMAVTRCVGTGLNSQ